MEYTLLIVIAVALFFDFTNGFHDTANAIATIVSTKALPPKVAVIGAAILNFAGAFLSLHVAATIASGIINPDVITLPTILGGLVGAIIWNLLTWRIGLPSSSSHALIGGVMGAAVATAGWNVVKWEGLEAKVLIPSFVSPFVGLIGAALLTLTIMHFVVKRYHKDSVNKFFRRAQIVSGGFVALMHGTNDAQKTMGIIALALAVTAGSHNIDIPLWVIVSSALAMAAGTWLGGWRIISTIGEKITKLEPSQGFAAQTSTAVTLGVTSSLGFPVSTTQTISGSIVGTGVAKGAAVNWNVIKNIVLAWFVTIPSAALMGALAELITRLPYGVGILFLLLVVIASGIYITRNWNWEVRAQLRTVLSLLQRRR